MSKNRMQKCPENGPSDPLDGFEDEMTALAESEENASARRGKNRRSSVLSHGIEFDSNEEVDVYEWLLEAERLGFVRGIVYQPEPFVLFDGLRNEKGKLVVRPHVYTADFRFTLTDGWRALQKAHKFKVFHRLVPDDGTVYIDVKGAFNRFGGDRNFGVNSKWVLAKYGVYVWKVEPKDLFSKTWLPEACRLTRKTHCVSKKYGRFLTFEHHGFRIPPVDGHK